MASTLELMVILFTKTGNERGRKRNNNDKIQIKVRLCGIGRGEIEKRNSNTEFSACLALSCLQVTSSISLSPRSLL